MQIFCNYDMILKVETLKRARRNASDEFNVRSNKELEIRRNVEFNLA